MRGATAPCRERLSGLELPTFKGRPGWEFTDISDLDLARIEPRRSAES